MAVTRELNNIQFAVTRELNNISETAFLEDTKKLKERANKCIDQGGMYFEESCPYKNLSVFDNSRLKTFGCSF